MMKKLSLKQKIVFSSSITVMLIMIVSSIFYFISMYQTLRNTKEEELTRSLLLSSSSMEEKLTSLNNLTLSLLSTPSMLNWRDFPTDHPIDMLTLKKEINTSLNLNALSEYIDFIYYTDDNFKNEEEPLQYLYGRKNLTLTASNDFKSVYTKIQDNKDTYFFYTYEKSEKNDLYLIRRMYDIHFQKYATFIIKLDSVAISKSLDSFDESMNIYVMNENRILFSNHIEKIGENYRISDKDIFTNLDHLTFQATAKTQSFAIRYPNSMFVTYVSFPTKLIIAPIWSILRSYILIFFVMMIIFIFIVGVVSNYFSAFLNDIHTQILNVKNSNYSTRVPSYKIPELNDLSHTINDMSENINNLINKNYKSQLLLKDADIHLLQSQISPHFLINTLTTISTQALIDGNQDIYEMAHNLSKMMDSSLYNTCNDSSFIAVIQELEYIKCYLSLQKVRFPNFDYEIQLEDDDIQEILIPRLSIEPLVENAVIHGVYHLTKPGHIIISISKTQKDVVFKITDNAGTYYEPSTASMEHHSIGIKNINKRLHLLYGDEYTISYTCIPGIETTAVCKIPITPNQEGSLSCQ